MAFDNLQVRAVKGLLTSFTNTIGHRSTGASSTWLGRERKIGESKIPGGGLPYGTDGDARRKF